jgi:protoheme IX farnesyltransferase
VRRKDVVALAVALVLLVLAQLWVGAATWAIRVPKDAAGELTTAQAVLPTLHLLIGAMILATSFALTLKSFRFSATGLPEKKTISAYVELAKPRIVSMVLVTTTIGFFLGGKGFHSPLLLIATLLGTASTAGGAAVLNNYIEREVDAKMERTRRRALPAGVIAPSNALSYGIILVLFGLGLLVWQVNLLTAFLELLATFLYVVVYTPMKRMTWLNTLIGAIPGAIPPMSGWAASAGQLDAGAWVLFLILFIWQHPHFYAIAWMFKDDYRSAGFKMLPVIDPSGRRTFRQTLAYSVLLIGASLLPTAIGMTGKIYLTGALSMGLMMLAIGAAFTVAKSYVAARRLLKASVIYLPVLLVLIIVDVGF